MTMHAIAGIAEKIFLPDDVTFEQRIIPVGLQRPGIQLWSVDPKIIAHETDNERVGANAIMHNNWLLGGAKDSNGNQTQTSFHFVVDGGIKGQSGPGRGGTIIQNVPVGEVTWQAADGFGPGNYDCDSIEGCVNTDGDENRMRRNYEYLAAGLLKASDRELDALGTHWDYNYANDPTLRHHCPQHMYFRDNYWPTFKNNVGQLLHPAPETTYVRATLPPWWSDMALNTPMDRVWKNVVFYYSRTIYHTIKDGVLAHATASDDGALTRKPLAKGEQFTGAYRFKAGGKWWIMTKYGSRIRASHCAPWISITQTPLT